MAPPRSFDYDYLRLLLREHPDWDLSRYAAALTAQKRETDPDAKRVLPVSVASAISRYRDTWVEEGDSVPDQRLPVYDELIWWHHIPAEYRMHIYLRKLRTIARMRRGLIIFDPKDQRQAAKFEADLRAAKRVVDIRGDGEPYLRKAKPEELDAAGNLLEIVARRRVPEPGRPGLAAGPGEDDPEIARMRERVLSAVSVN